MAISSLAYQLLRLHARTPNRLFYGSAVLGPMFQDDAIAALDQAYKELEQNKLMAPAGAIVSFFGSPKSVYRITPEGRKTAEKEVAA